MALHSRAPQRIAEDDEPSVEELLRPPDSFARELPTMTLRRPFSPKLRRKLSLYGERPYCLWVALESNPEIADFNLQVLRIPMITGRGCRNVSPAGISVARSGEIVIHAYERRGGRRAHTDWRSWSERMGFGYVGWSSVDLVPNLTAFENKCRLIRFISVPDEIPDPQLADRIFVELRSVRKVNLAWLAQQFCGQEEAAVYGCIAKMILDARIYSDINARPLGKLTEVSAYANEL